MRSRPKGRLGDTPFTTEAFLPPKGQVILTLPGEILRKFRNIGLDYKIDEALLIPDAVLHPTEVWDIIRDDWEGDEGKTFAGGSCYAKTGLRQTVVWEGRSFTRPEGRVFCIFVNPRGVIFEWGFEEKQPGGGRQSCCFAGAGLRFGRRIWPR